MTKKNKLPKYKDGGMIRNIHDLFMQQEDGSNTLFKDLFNTYSNTMLGSLGIEPQGQIDNDFLKKASDIGNSVYAAVTPVAANALLPGSGTAIQEVGQSLQNTIDPQQNPQSNEQLNIDPRFTKLAQGGQLPGLSGALPQISVNPQGGAGTDQIETDAQGNPSAISGQKGVAMTDSGEVMWNGYVFSDDLGFADKAKTILKKYEFRLGKDFDKPDKLSKDQMDTELGKLAELQEASRPIEPQQTPLPGLAKGGLFDDDPIYIYGTHTTIGSKPAGIVAGGVENPSLAPSSYPIGGLGDKSYIDGMIGHNTQFAKDDKLFNPVATNSTIEIPEVTITGSLSDYNKKIADLKAMTAPPGGYINNDIMAGNRQGEVTTTGKKTIDTAQKSYQEQGLVTPIEENYPLPDQVDSTSVQQRSSIKRAAFFGGQKAANQAQQALIGASRDLSGAPESEDFFGKLKDDPAAVSALLQAGLLTARGINALTSKKNKVSPATYMPERISLAEQREEAKKARNRSASSLRNVSRNDRAAQIAAITALDQGLSSTIGDSLLRERSYNAQAGNRARQYNAQARSRAAETNAQEDAAKVAMIDSLIASGGNIISGYAREKQLYANQDTMRKALKQAYPNFTLDELDIVIRQIEKFKKQNKKP